MRNLILIIVISVCSLSAQAEWGFARHGNTAYEDLVTSADGQRLLLGTRRAGYWLTNDGGQSWQPIDDRILPEFRLTPLTVYGADPELDTMAVVSSPYPFTRPFHQNSTDGGQTWQPFYTENNWPWPDSIDTGEDYIHICREPSNRIYVSRPFGTAYSNDGGTTWDVTSYPELLGGILGNWAPLGQEDTLYVFGTYSDDGMSDPRGGLIATYDGGISWERIIPLEELHPGQSGAVRGILRLDNGHLLVWTSVFFDGSPLRILISEDNGESWYWRYVEGIPSLDLYDIVAVDDIPGRLLASVSMYPAGVYQSDDYGHTWQREYDGLPENPGVVKLYKNSFSGNLYSYQWGDGIFRSTDSGDSWTEVPMPERLGIEGHKVDGVLAGEGGTYNLSNIGYLYKADGAETAFSRIPLIENDVPPEIRYMQYPIEYSDSLMQYTVNRVNLQEGSNNYSIYSSRDNGESWSVSTEVHTGQADLDHVLKHTREDTTWSVRYSLVGNEMLLSYDQENWQQIDLDFTNHWVSLQEGILYTYDLNNTGIYISEDMGRTWNNMQHPDNAGLWQVGGKIYEHEDELYALAGYPALCWVYHPDFNWWENRGEIPSLHPQKTWELVTSPTDTFLVAGDELLPDALCVSTDMGWTWELNPLEHPFEDQGRTVYHIEYDPYRDRLWVSTGAGPSWIDLSGSTVGEPWTLIPAGHETLTAYPNPFNSTTTVRYTLSRPGEISLSVYDLLGRRVVRLDEGRMPAGQHTLPFDAASLSSGQYFLRLMTGEQVLDRKVTVVK